MFIAFPAIILLDLEIDYQKIRSNDTVIHDQYGSLFEEFHYEKGLKFIMYYPIISLRAVIYAINIFYISDQSVKISLSISSSFLILTYLIYFRPFKSVLILITNIVIEVVFAIIFILILLRIHSSLLDKDKVFDYVFMSALLFGFISQYIICFLIFILKLKSIWRKFRDKDKTEIRN